MAETSRKLVAEFARNLESAVVRPPETVTAEPGTEAEIDADVSTYTAEIAAEIAADVVEVAEEAVSEVADSYDAIANNVTYLPTAEPEPEPEGESLLKRLTPYLTVAGLLLIARIVVYSCAAADGESGRLGSRRRAAQKGAPGRFRSRRPRRRREPIVILNSPFLADGTPMPTLYWLVGRIERESVSRLESTGASGPPKLPSTSQSSRSPMPVTRRFATPRCPLATADRGPRAVSGGRAVA